MTIFLEGKSLYAMKELRISSYTLEALREGRCDFNLLYGITLYVFEVPVSMRLEHLLQ